MDLGLSQGALARKLGVHLATLSSWERHETEPPIQFVPRIVEFLRHDPVPLQGDLSGRLAAYRRKHGLSLTALAEKIGVHKETLAGIEYRRRKPNRRSLAVLKRIL